LLKAAATASLGFALVCGLLILLAGIAAPAAAAPRAATLISADIIGDAAWTPAGSPYIISGTVSVYSGTLTVGPGVAVRFERHAELIIQSSGRLEAVGTPGQPITFTSGVTPGPASCDWDAIRFNSSGNRVQYALLEYATWGLDLREPYGEHDISYTTFRHNGLCAMSPVGGAIVGSTDVTTITHNTFLGNAAAVRLAKSSENLVAHNVVSGTTQPAIAFVRSLATRSSYNQILSNTVHAAQDTGIHVDQGDFNEVSGNLVYDNWGEGILVIDQGSGLVADNRVYGNAGQLGPAPTAGVEVRDSRGVEVRGNLIYANGAPGVTSYRAGLYLFGSQDTQVTGNFIHDNLADDGLAYGATNSGTPLIAGNAVCRDPAFELRSLHAASLPAEANWWGTNLPAREITGTVDYDPWIRLDVTPASSSLRADGVSTTTLAITFNDGAGHSVPPSARLVNVTASAGSLSAPAVTVNASGQASLTLTAPAAPGTAVVTATDACGYAVTDTVTFAGYVDLSVVKTASGPPYGPGDLITYTISYRNQGNGPAAGVVLTETLPANTTFAGSPPGWTRVGSTDQYTYAGGNLPAGGGPLTASFVVRIDPALPAGTTTFTNVVRVGDNGAAGPDFYPPDNVYSLAVSGGSLPDLWAVKNDNVGPGALSGPVVGSLANTESGLAFLQLVHSADEVGAQDVPEGGLITYTIGYGNSALGTAPATGVVLSETLPLYTTYAGPACGAPDGWCQVGATRVYTRWVGGPLNPVAGDYAYFRVRVGSSLPPAVTEVINRVCIYGNEPDLIPDNNCSTEETGVITGTYNLGVTKAANATCLNAGDAFYYQISVSNAGANAAQNALLIESPPAGTLAVNLPGSGWIGAGGVYTYDLGLVPSGVVTAVPFWVQIDPALAPGVTALTNTVEVRADGTDSDPADNLYRLVSPVGTTPDLAITKNDNILDRVDPGGVISYSIAYVNNSHAYAASRVVITETLPAGTSIYGPSAPLWHRVGATNLYTYAVGSMEPGAAGAVEFVVRVDDPFLAGSEVVNRVEIGGAESECNPANNAATEETPVQGADGADLMATKVDDVPVCVVPGDLIQYTISYTNNSYTNPAADAALTELIDTGSAGFVGPAGWTPAGAGVYSRSLGEVGARAGGVFSFTVQVADTLPAGQTSITNVVRISTASPDWNPANNVYTLTTWAPESPELLVVKNDNVGSLALEAAGVDRLLSRLRFSPEALALLHSRPAGGQVGAQAEQVNPGDLITYTIILGNLGRAGATGVVLTETLPAGTTFVGPGYWTPAGGGRYRYAYGVLGQGLGDVLQFIVRVDDPFMAGDRVINTVEIGGAPQECELGNNRSTDETPVAGAGYASDLYLPLVLKDAGEPVTPTPIPLPTATPTPTPTPTPLGWASDVAVDPASNRVFVASPREDAVHVVLGASDTYSRSVGVGHGPTGLAVLTATSPSKVFVAHAYAYNYWRPGVWLVDAGSLAGRPMTDHEGYVGAAPIRVAANPITRRAFVSNYFDRMAILDAANETWLASVPEHNFQASYGVDASRANNLVYIAARDTGELIVFDAAAAEADPGGYSPCHHAPPGADSWQTSRVLRMVAVNQATGHVFVASPPDPNKSFQTDSRVFVLDEATLLAETARHGGRPSAQTCLWNFGVFGGEVSAAAIPGPAWLTSTLVLPGAISAGEEGIAVNPATGRVYVTDGPGDRLFILQDGPTAGGIAFVTSVAVGDNPQGVAVNPATNKVYVANARSAGAPYGTLTVIDGATHAILKTVDLVGP
jgi:uncharacterized repeat protein (TIGR01451 family)